MRYVRENSLSLFFLVLFLLALVGQAIAGHAQYNNEQLAHMSETVSFWRFVSSSEFGQAVMENWQSEYLQFTLFIGATIWLHQRGSPESKPLDEIGTESDASRRGRGRVRQWVYSNSLLVVMGAIWIGSWFAHSVTGWSAYNAEQLAHQQPTVGWLGFVGTADFWESTLENWQSEFLAVGSMVVLSIYLRQRGSPESKPVGASHEATGVES
jgi:hypothetical protein